MEKIFTTKLSLQSSNPTFSYPIIRLPRELKELTGRIVNVYQTEIGGVPGLVVSQLDKLDKFGPIEAETTIDQRLSTLESQITELKSLILENTSCLRNISKKEAPESGFEPNDPDGDGGES